MVGWYNNPSQCGRESALKSRVARGNGTLGNCMWRDQHLLGDVGDHQRGLGKSQLLWTLPNQTVRRCFRACANILSMPIFCRPLYFVDAYILLMLIICQRKYFVNANILSTPIFCRRQYFVDANILSPPIFCLRQYFVCA
jgi:hypothetical protein